MPDFIVVGAGIAGLRAAIELAAAGPVLVIAKESLRESSSEYAQGGIAAALGEDDSVDLHAQDTLAAGDGLSDPEAVRVLVRSAPAAISELIEWGAEFDREDSRLALGREGAHSRRRVLHAKGDSTGSEIARTLFRKAASLPAIEFRSFSAVTDLLVADGEVAGVVVCDEASRQALAIPARAVLLATGGLGRIYRVTTNPDVATGDGVAAAYRAGAELADLEFVQFHPTALRLEGAPPFLLSEALRGEGALLVNSAGERFMPRYHPLAELAPRDVVSRAIVMEMARTGASSVFLDARPLGEEMLRRRFPRIYRTCLAYGLDLAREPVPVHPAAHYAMGGVWTDLDGRTSLPRLFAAGEVAATGVHGANRLASNSLLEALVFGARAGRAMRELAGTPVLTGSRPAEATFPSTTHEQLQSLAWDHCGILRSGPQLERACAVLEAMTFAPAHRPARALFELRNMQTVIWLIARCALARRESRGAHYRTDFPGKNPDFQKHSRISKHHDVRFR
ncbi:MAG: L-aspartate oxidase [Bryobacterales bacterium]|nr:L-aspartate oxidase [Bryobacteraceae bacterium]MDW8129371.1 L-aspartate oxidase [Bryobacterales bacterium]